MKNPKALLIVVAIIALILVGFVFFRGPKPIIEIKAETLVDIGPFPLKNTYVSSIAAVVVILTLAYLGARKASLIPHRIQNLVEAVFEAGYNLCVNTAGEKYGRRFFPLFMTIFIFIWVANWMALLPFFNAIGAVEKVSAEEFHKQASVLSKTGGISLVKTGDKLVEFNVDTSPCTFDTAPVGQTLPADASTRQTDCVLGQRAAAIVTELKSKHGINPGDLAACSGQPGDRDHTECLVALSDMSIAQLHSDGKELGVIAPYFRSMNTDINSPLSIAIMSAIFVEFWGVTALGFFKYVTKFFTISSPINFFVGVLEFIAEVARLISFTFRLFGNLLAGEILLLVMTFLLPFVVALPFYGLEMFVGVIQAFVFAMLTLVFGVLAVSTHDDHDEHEPVEVTALH